VNGEIDEDSECWRSGCEGVEKACTH
jgi:hypothetical protein